MLYKFIKVIKNLNFFLQDFIWKIIKFFDYFSYIDNLCIFFLCKYTMGSFKLIIDFIKINNYYIFINKFIIKNNKFITFLYFYKLYNIELYFKNIILLSNIIIYGNNLLEIYLLNKKLLENFLNNKKFSNIYYLDIFYYSQINKYYKLYECEIIKKEIYYKFFIDTEFISFNFIDKNFEYPLIVSIELWYITTNSFLLYNINKNIIYNKEIFNNKIYYSQNELFLDIKYKIIYKYYNISLNMEKKKNFNLLVKNDYILRKKEEFNLKFIYLKIMNKVKKN